MSHVAAGPVLPVNELSRKITVGDLNAAGLAMRIEASLDECRALARRFGLIAVNSLTAEVNASPAGDGGVRVFGRFAAEAAQACVVTLESLTERVEGTVDVLFLPGNYHDDGEVTVSAVGDDDPEPLIGDEIDVGEVVAQQFGLEMNSYPRRPGAELGAARDRVKKDKLEPSESPFAVLRHQRPKR